ncbi:MAG: Pr6Pr family membrane protein [Microbacterium sp.]
MRLRRAYGWGRLIAASACLGTLTYRLVFSLLKQSMIGQNFFAYLTMQSNIAFALVTAVGGVIALHRMADPAWFTAIRGLVITWTVTAGLGFAIIVWQASVRGIKIGVPWPDIVLHFVIPALALVTWITAPGRTAAPWRIVPLALIYPIVWGIFTLWRGARVGWYPYYFMDPRLISGPMEFVVSSGILLAVFAAVAAGLVWISHHHSTLPHGVGDGVGSGTKYASDASA